MYARSTGNHSLFGWHFELWGHKLSEVAIDRWREQAERMAVGSASASAPVAGITESSSISTRYYRLTTQHAHDIIICTSRSHNIKISQFITDIVHSYSSSTRDPIPTEVLVIASLMD